MIIRAAYETSSVVLLLTDVSDERFHDACTRDLETRIPLV